MTGPSKQFSDINIGASNYEIVEDSGGDLVVRDDNGNDVFMWDSSAGQWDFKSADVANLGSLRTDLDVGGNFIVNVGDDGSNDVAQSGAVRLGEGRSINTRDSVNLNDIQMIASDGTPNPTISLAGPDASSVKTRTDLDVDANTIQNVESTTDANSGGFRAGDGTELNARDTTDSLDHGLGLTSADLTDGGKTALSTRSEPQGYAMVQDTTNNVSCMVYLGGASGTVEILHDAGSSNNFTTTEDNDGTTNIYYDSSNSQYELNNETGGSATYTVEVLQA